MMKLRSLERFMNWWILLHWRNEKLKGNLVSDLVLIVLQGMLLEKRYIVLMNIEIL